MILGGDTGEGEPTGGPFVLDLKTHTWSVLHCDGELPRGTVGHCSAAIDSRVYVFGGFDPHTDHRAPAQARQIPGCTLTWSNPMPCRLQLYMYGAGVPKRAERAHLRPPWPAASTVGGAGE